MQAGYGTKPATLAPQFVYLNFRHNNFLTVERSITKVFHMKKQTRTEVESVSFYLFKVFHLILSLFAIK